MERIIELLEKYLNENNNPISDLKHINHTFQNKDVLFSDELVISKRFGFIKRLTDNKKLKYSLAIEEYDIFSQEELHIMWLSISETPIEDLISNLKPDDRTSRSTNR